MSTNGFIRKVDDLGRIVIPKEIRTNLNIEENSPLEIFSDSTSITIKKLESMCVFCSSKTKLLNFNSKLICSNCINKITKLKNTN